MNNDTVMTSTDTTRFDLARAASIFDPRADMDAEGDQGGSLKGDVDATDQTLFDNKKATWDPLEAPPSVGQPFSDVGNPYQFQGVPHFALDSGAFSLAAKLLLNHHRARFADPVIGRWTTRDPLCRSLTALQPQVNYIAKSFLLTSTTTPHSHTARASCDIRGLSSQYLAVDSAPTSSSPW